MDHPSRRPARPFHPRNDDTAPFLAPDDATIDAIARAGRPIWSPYYGHGRLIGQIGYPPAFAHVAEYPDLPEEARRRPCHTSAFFILN